jgi:hypothetical protein
MFWQQHMNWKKLVETNFKTHAWCEIEATTMDNQGSAWQLKVSKIHKAQANHNKCIHAATIQLTLLQGETLGNSSRVASICLLSIQTTEQNAQKESILQHNKSTERKTLNTHMVVCWMQPNPHTSNNSRNVFQTLETTGASVSNEYCHPCSVTLLPFLWASNMIQPKQPKPKQNQ